ncbi:transcription factor LUX-like [Impatiens glandulifera]|uniref:transcription factor LUX-like n=1 Tax=Impatiens glandulifera TaxID=253017 RepID=UPI001FB0AA22|nr:transcription factor LUX-like [Impatiens glandulifera]
MEYNRGDETGDEDRVKMEWEVGLPTQDELIPVTHCLISPELAYAFGIVLEPCIKQASQDTLASLGSPSQSQPLSRSNNFDSMLLEDQRTKNCVVVGGDDDMDFSREDGSVSSKRRKLQSIDVYTEESDLSLDLNRARLVWTQQIHKRFIDVVAHLGIKDAVPKTILKLMNVEGLTREDVSIHLQKYRLYLDRMEILSDKMKGLSTDGSSSSDHLSDLVP